MRFYECTDYPEIYKKVYWGNFNAHSVFREDEMITNRNNFIKLYNIKNVREQYKLDESTWEKCALKKKGLDHIELYSTKDGKKMQVCSQNKNAGEGWEEVSAMYSSQFGTYVRYVTMKQVREEHRNN